jgi:hypothetical protein
MLGLLWRSELGTQNYRRSLSIRLGEDHTFILRDDEIDKDLKIYFHGGIVGLTEIRVLIEKRKKFYLEQIKSEESNPVDVVNIFRTTQLSNFL